MRQSLVSTQTRQAAAKLLDSRSRYPVDMPLPVRDSELIQIMDASLADATRRAGPWLACRPGCTQCCHGAFAISALDAARLQSGMKTLSISDPQTSESIHDRARTWITEHAPDFPGNLDTGILGISEQDQARFEDFANDAPCPALNPQTGLCDIYDFRPMTCRVFGPPIRVADGDSFACCELCFIGATDNEIAACEMPLPHQLEEQLLAETGDSAETVVAFALLR
jgi:Fe-S-cluster containining protein